MHSSRKIKETRAAKPVWNNYPFFPKQIYCKKVILNLKNM